MNYRNYEEFSDEMCRKLGKLKIQEVKIERLEMSGFISGKRAIYAKQVAMFDFTLCEAKGLAVLNLFDKTAVAMSDAKRLMDGILISAFELDGNSVVYEIAKNRYNTTLTRVETLLESRNSGEIN